MSNPDGQTGPQGRAFAPQTSEQRAQQHPQGADRTAGTVDRFALQRALLVGGIAGVGRTAQPG